MRQLFVSTYILPPTAYFLFSAAYAPDVISLQLVGIPTRQVVTGAASGDLYVWSGRNCVRSLRGHYGPVTAMFSGPYGLISGGKVWERSTCGGGKALSRARKYSPSTCIWDTILETAPMLLCVS